MKNIETPAEEPGYVEKYDAFMESALLEDPSEIYSLAARYPDLRFSFGEITDTCYYIKIGIKDVKNSSIETSFPQYSTPRARHDFVFTIEDDGSLSRLIEILPKNPSTEPPKPLASNLGIEAGEKFVKNLTAKKPKLPKDLDKLFALDEAELEALVEVHNKLMSSD